MRIGQEARAESARLGGNSTSQQVTTPAIIACCPSTLCQLPRPLVPPAHWAVCDAAQIVSVMLPSVRSQDGHNTSLTSLDHLYVVLLQPGESYTTYACSLDHLVFA